MYSVWKCFDVFGENSEVRMSMEGSRRRRELAREPPAASELAREPPPASELAREPPPYAAVSICVANYPRVPSSNYYLICIDTDMIAFGISCLILTSYVKCRARNVLPPFQDN